jgi:hypothetical protein
MMLERELKNPIPSTIGCAKFCTAGCSPTAATSPTGASLFLYSVEHESVRCNYIHETFTKDWACFGALLYTPECPKASQTWPKLAKSSHMAECVQNIGHLLNCAVVSGESSHIYDRAGRSSDQQEN